jgi:hypothetical protein
MAERKHDIKNPRGQLTSTDTVHNSRSAVFLFSTLML